MSSRPNRRVVLLPRPADRFGLEYPGSENPHMALKRVPRSKMVSVRFTEQEYLTLELACVTRGERSVSDFAREAIRVFLRNTEIKESASVLDGYQAAVKSLEKKVEDLETKLAGFENNSPG